VGSSVIHIVTISETLTTRHKQLSGLFSKVTEGPPEKALERGAHIAEETSLVSACFTKSSTWRSLGSAEETHLLERGVMYQLFSGA